MAGQVSLDTCARTSVVEIPVLRRQLKLNAPRIAWGPRVFILSLHSLGPPMQRHPADSCAAIAADPRGLPPLLGLRSLGLLLRPRKT